MYCIDLGISVVFFSFGQPEHRQSARTDTTSGAKCVNCWENVTGTPATCTGTAGRDVAIAELHHVRLLLKTEFQKILGSYNITEDWYKIVSRPKCISL